MPLPAAVPAMQCNAWFPNKNFVSTQLTLLSKFTKSKLYDFFILCYEMEWIKLKFEIKVMSLFLNLCKEIMFKCIECDKKLLIYAPWLKLHFFYNYILIIIFLFFILWHNSSASCIFPPKNEWSVSVWMKNFLHVTWFHIFNK